MGFYSCLVLKCFFTTLCVSFSLSQERKIVGCYFTNWSQYRGGVAKFQPHNINTTLCTHVHYLYARVNTTASGLQSIEPNEPGYYYDVTNLKQTKPDLKVLLTVGAGAAISQATWLAVSNDSLVDAFCQSAVLFLRLYNFDGIEITWKTPTTNDIYIKIIQAMRSAIDKEELVEGRERLLLSASVPVEAEGVTLFSPRELAVAADYISVTAYDFYGSWSDTLGHHSPLYPSDAEPPDSYKSQHEAVELWLKAGVTPNKLVLGVAAYGRTQRMTSANLHAPGDPADTALPTVNGPLTRSPGTYAYFELCNKLADGWTRVLMEESRAPYVYGRDTVNGVPDQLVWISHDDVQSYTEKAEYAASRGLGGVAVLSLDSDDFTGTVCGQGQYPLLTTVYTVLPAPICSFRTWGPKCSEQCGQCEGPRPCDRVTGVCPRGCLPGWIGDRCDQECSDGTFGPGCSQTCKGHCKGGQPCDKVSGECTQGCQDGWTDPPVCDQQCSDGTFGSNCSQTCSGHCKGGQPCDKTSGECTQGCQYGWRGAACDQECSDGTFGPNCNQTCRGHCEGRQPCDKVSGECTQGCQDGWTEPPICDQPPGDKFPLIPVVAAAVAFVFLTGVITAAGLRWRQKKRKRVYDGTTRNTEHTADKSHTSKSTFRGNSDSSDGAMVHASDQPPHSYDSVAAHYDDIDDDTDVCDSARK